MHRSYLHFLLPMVALFIDRIHSEGIADVSFQRVQQTIGFDVFKSDLRITKFNRTCAVMNGTIDLLVDMDNRFSIKSAHSRLGNNQFNEYPYKIAENPFCHVMNETYREYEDLFEKTTNLPHVGADVTCPVPAGNYWFKHFTFKPETMPQMIPEGYWRLTVLITAEDGRKADLQIFLKVSKESYW